MKVVLIKVGTAFKIEWKYLGGVSLIAVVEI